MNKRKNLNVKLNAQKIKTVLYWQRKCWGKKQRNKEKQRCVTCCSMAPGWSSGVFIIFQLILKLHACITCPSAP